MTDMIAINSLTTDEDLRKQIEELKGVQNKLVGLINTKQSYWSNAVNECVEDYKTLLTTHNALKAEHIALKEEYKGLLKDHTALHGALDRLAAARALEPQPDSDDSDDEDDEDDEDPSVPGKMTQPIAIHQALIETIADYQMRLKAEQYMNRALIAEREILRDRIKVLEANDKNPSAPAA